MVAKLFLEERVGDLGWEEGKLEVRERGKFVFVSTSREVDFGYVGWYWLRVGSLTLREAGCVVG
jgi:hypothetical protein